MQYYEQGDWMVEHQGSSASGRALLWSRAFAAPVCPLTEQGVISPALLPPKCISSRRPIMPTLLTLIAMQS